MGGDPNELPYLLSALVPYLPDLVFVGGWVPELYKRYGDVEWSGPLSRTTELDVLVSSTLAPNGRVMMRALLEAHGLRPARTEHFPADWVSAVSGVTEIEFIMARVGPAVSDSPRQIEQQGYLGAILVDHTDLLAAFTRTLVVDVAGRRLPVRVPTLGAWAVSKALTFGARQMSATGALGFDKRAKDLLYVRDLVFAGGTVLRNVEEDIAEVAADAGRHPMLRRAIGTLTPVAGTGAETEVHRAAVERATRDGVAVATAIAEVRGAARHLRELVAERLPRAG